MFWGRNLDPRRGVADAEFYGKSTEIHGESVKSMEYQEKSMENPWKSTENPRKSIENHGKSWEKTDLAALTCNMELRTILHVGIPKQLEYA